MTKRSFNFPLSTLLLNGDAIIGAGEANLDRIQPRLPENYTADTRALINTITGQATDQKSKAGDVGALTQEQKVRLKVVQGCMSKARDTAKRAFKGQDVKLHEEFQVGVNKPNDLGAVLGRARIVAASLKKPENAAAVAAKGWVAADTQKFDAAIAALGEVDNTQEGAKGKSKQITEERNISGNDLYERLLTIQNAANLEWPEEVPGNVEVRARFRLDTFPPGAQSGSEPEPEPEPQPAVAAKT